MNLVASEPRKAKSIEKAVRSGNVQEVKQLLQDIQRKNPIITRQPEELKRDHRWRKYERSAREAFKNKFQKLSDSKKDTTYTFVRERFDSANGDSWAHLTVLNFAAYLGKLEIFKFVSKTLIDDKNPALPNPNSPFSSGFSPLHWAALAGHMDIVTYILNKTELVNMNMVSDLGATPAALATIGKIRFCIVFKISYYFFKCCNLRMC